MKKAVNCENISFSAPVASWSLGRDKVGCIPKYYLRHNIVVGGGSSNCATGYRSNVLGGQSNTNSAINYGTITGGCANIICTNSSYGFIGSGSNNIIDNSYSAIVGGANNCVSGPYSSIGGGLYNCVADYSGVASGCCNSVSSGSTYSFAGGGYLNYVDKSNYSAILGGISNHLQSTLHSSITGGFSNCINKGYSNTIAGGNCNSINIFCNEISVIENFIGSGSCNNVISQFSGILGGVCNTIGNATIASTFFPAYGVIGGGFCNCIDASSSSYSSYNFVGNGFTNIICNTSVYSSILNGKCNTHSGLYSGILGGSFNVINDTAVWSSIVSGSCNTNSGQFSAILGGCCNTISSAYNYAGVFGQGITASASYAFHANCLIAPDTPNGGTGLSPGSIYFLLASVTPPPTAKILYII